MSATFRFGLGIPTATEGIMYPVPYADIDQATELAISAERLGFDSVWGNDHVTTQSYVRDAFAEPPRFYDPWTFLAYVAASTSSLRLATAILVLPFRHPVNVAKQASTLDQLSDGRLMLGVGVGAYREEFESMQPGRVLHRGRHADEFLESLNLLLNERRASYSGEWIQFVDIESYPKPVQTELPILSGGNSAGSRRRAATTANGWLPACLTPEEYKSGLNEIRRIESESNSPRDRPFEAALQLVVSIRDKHELAVEGFRSSHLHRHLMSLGSSTMKGRLAGSLEERNLVGNADEIGERIWRYAEAGVGVFAGLLFATDTVEGTLEAMQQFSEQVIRPLTSSSAP